MSAETNPYPPKSCPGCGQVLTAGVVAGSLCPRCLLAAGLADRGMTATNPGRHLSGSQNRWEPPLPIELANQFPELEILELAGRGGMGAVFKVRQKDLNRIVALKVLPPEVAENPTFAVRFERESQALAKLNHPNIVQVYRSGKTDRYFYFLMEFVDGVNLRETIRAGKLEPHEALAIVPQICEALQYAHDAGIVHRDIKPENILLDNEGRVKVTDFGLAKMVDWGHDASLTGTQQVMGTAHYMAPEQVQETRNVDHRADIYSLGVVFYEMLTGQLPIGRFALPSESTSVDPRLDRVVMRTLENEPDRRYQAASEVKSDIDSIGHNLKPDQPQMGKTSFVPLPPVKQALEQATRKVWAPAICLQIIGYLSLAISMMLAMFILLMIVVLTPTSRTVSQSGAIQALGSTATLNAHGGYRFPLAILEPPMQQDSVGASFASNGDRLPFTPILLVALCFFHLPISIMMIIAGRKMIRLESYGFVLVTCILAMLPLNPLFFFFSLVTAIWSLVVLNNSTVQQAFEERKIGSFQN